MARGREGGFRDLGDVETELKAPLVDDAEEELLVAFIEGVIEPRGLIYGGSVLWLRLQGRWRFRDG